MKKRQRKKVIKKTTLVKLSSNFILAKRISNIEKIIKILSEANTIFQDLPFAKGKEQL